MSKSIKLRLAAFLLFSLSLPPLGALAADTDETPGSAGNQTFEDLRRLVDAGEYENALPALEKLDQESPDNPDVLNLIGFSMRKTGKLADALVFYNKALALNPMHLGANEYLGELYLETKQPEMAKARLAVLEKACGDCDEFMELKEKIEGYRPQS
ncbi:tetratricopeptide repeat protein [Dongia sp.]|uniref:tetratricopeptide repeat protein n=1 Tax=Dongia sp. TaxID=1977262 RepID=UPI0035B1D14F